MNLIYEDLARVHIRERQQEAEEARAAYGLLRLRKVQRNAERERRKAERAHLAASRLLASLVLD